MSLISNLQGLIDSIATKLNTLDSGKVDKTSLDAILPSLAGAVVVLDGTETRPTNDVVFWLDMREGEVSAPSNMGESDVRFRPGTVTSGGEETGVAPTITTTTMGTLTQGTIASRTISYTGDTVTSVTVSAGTMIPGMTASVSSGVVTVAGTPTTSGAYDFTLQVTNATGSDTQQYTGTVNATGTGGATGSTMFGENAYPYTQTYYTDGGGSLKMATVFYSKTAGITVNGARVYLPSVPSDGDLHLFCVKVFNDISSVATASAVIDWAKVNPTDLAGQIVTIPAASITTGWNEVTFATSVTIGADPETNGWADNSVIVGYYFDGGNAYVFTPSPVTTEIQSVLGSDLYIPAATIGVAKRSLNNFDWSDALYGIDIVTGATS